MRVAVYLSHPIQHFGPLWRELARRPGVEVKVWYYGRQGVEESLDRDFGVRMAWDVDLLEGYEHEFLPRRWPTRDPLDCTWKGLNRGLDQGLSGRVDVAYVAGYAHVNNWMVAQSCHRLGIPLLFQSDSNFLTEQRRPIWRRWLKRRFLRPFFNRVGVFLACGDHNRDYLLNYGAPPDRIRFSAIPVDTDRFQRAISAFDARARALLRKRFGMEPNDFVAGFSGKFVSHKRPLDLIRALRTLNRDAGVALYIGAGSLESELRAQGGPARYTGFVNQALLPQVLSICDAVIIPSERDAHPLAVTEAQCLGIPVVLSDRCGCYGPNDVFRHQESGLLYPCGDVKRLSEALAWLMDHPQDRARMGRRARELAEFQSVRSTVSDFLAASELAVSMKGTALR